jgi:hypothetical protein
MNETSRYYRSSFTKMRERGWTVIPWESGQSNQGQVLDWLRTNGFGEFYYSAESNKLNFSIVIKEPTDARLFKQHFGVEDV